MELVAVAKGGGGSVRVAKRVAIAACHNPPPLLYAAGAAGVVCPRSLACFIHSDSPLALHLLHWFL